jgi:hypothetical protein
MSKSIVEIQGQLGILDSTFSLQNLFNIPGDCPVYSSAIAPETQGYLDEAITLAKQYLHNAASRDDFDELFSTIFGDRYNQQLAGNLRQDFIDGNIDTLFQLNNLADDILGSAQGAFAQETNTIYLGDSLLNSRNVEQITNVFLEEFIHGIDSLINTTDAQGDEGDIGSRLIRGEAITSDELALLKQENDQATIFLNGQAIAIEQALPTLTLSMTDGTAAETNTGQLANPGNFRFTRTGSRAKALTVYYNIAGTAIKGTDYNNLTGAVVIPIGATSVNVAIAPINDAAYEGTEKVTLSLKTNRAYTLNAAKVGTIKILDNNKPTLTITANDASAAEVTAGLTQNPGQFTLTRSGNTASALTTYYTIAGTATKGTDYSNLTGTVSFAAGSATAKINLGVIDDAIYEDSENVILTLSANTAYNLGAANTATVAIADNDIADDWYSQNLQDAGIIALTRSLASDGNLSRNDMISIFHDAKDGSIIDSFELTDFRTIVSNDTRFNMADYVKVLSNKIANGNVANTNSEIGNLYAGSSSTQMESLIGKWFLGTDRPDLTSSSYSYRSVSGSLFQNGINANDIDQNALGDCYFLATLSSIAHDKSSYISNMFINNGDNTFTIRFFNNGVADYVTVDSYLPTNSSGYAVYAGWGGGSNTSSSNELWVALAEKAYAQLAESGWSRSSGSENAYEDIEGGWMDKVIQQVTGLATTSRLVSGMTQTELINLVSSNKILTAGFVYGGGYGVVNSHAYTITSYNSTNGTFYLRNPWGTQHADVTWSQLVALRAIIQWSNV